MGSQAHITQSNRVEPSTELNRERSQLEIGNQSYWNLAKHVMSDDLLAHERCRWLTVGTAYAYMCVSVCACVPERSLHISDL